MKKTLYRAEKGRKTRTKYFVEERRLLSSIYKFNILLMRQVGLKSFLLYKRCISSKKINCSYTSSMVK